jgi:hypothetical protein
MWDNAEWVRMGGSMRALKIATIVMGVLVVVGTMGLIIGVARRASAPAPFLTALPVSVAVVLDEPEGTRISGIATVRDRVAVQLEGGGVDRIVLIDPTTGAISGRIRLAR